MVLASDRSHTEISSMLSGLTEGIAHRPKLGALANRLKLI